MLLPESNKKLNTMLITVLYIDVRHKSDATQFFFIKINYIIFFYKYLFVQKFYNNN